MKTSWTKFCSTGCWVLLTLELVTHNSITNAEIPPIVGDWGYEAGACTNFSNASTWSSDCVHLDGGRWAGLDRWCLDMAHPRPWADEALMEPLVSARNGGATTSFNGWLAAGESTFCLGYFDTGKFTSTLGVESSNFGLFTINGNSGRYGARRDRKIECPKGSRPVAGRCVRQNAADPYKGFNQCPANSTNPVDSFSGEKIHVETDYLGVDSNPLRFTRYYGSDSALRPGIWEPSGFGRYWRHSYSRSIKHYDNGIERFATLYLENGDRHYYKQVELGSNVVWESIDPDVVGQLTLSTTSGRRSWVYVNRQGEFEHYDFLTGQLTSITSSDGFDTTLNYNEQGQLAQVTNAFGRGLAFIYQSSGVGKGLIASVTVTIDGRPISNATYRYTYENTRNRGGAVIMIDKVFYPDTTPSDDGDNPFKDYLYNEPRNLYAEWDEDVELGPSTKSFQMPRALTGIIDENGDRFATYKYKRFLFSGGTRRALAAGGGHGAPDENGKFANQYTILAYSSGADTADSRSHTGRTAIRDAMGVRRDHHFALSHGVLRPTKVIGDKCDSCGGGIQATQYDPATGFVASETDFLGNRTVIKHDEHGLEVCRIEGVATDDPTKSVPRRTITQWDPLFRTRTLETIYAPSGTPDLDQCHPDNHIGWEQRKQIATTYTLGSGRVATRTERHFPLDPLHPERKTRFSYYTAGETDGLENQLKSIDGPRTDVADVTIFRYAMVSSATHNRGDLVAITNPIGHATRYTAHDLHGRNLKFIDSNNTVNARRYDPRGRIIESRIGNFSTEFLYDAAGNMAEIRLADNLSTKFHYDDAHRVTAVEDNVGNRIDYTLDPLGNRTQEDVSDADGVLVRRIARMYNELNRLEQTANGVGDTSSFTYDANGNLDTTTDPTLNASDRNYDALNRLREVIDPLGNATAFRFDELDNLVSIIDPRSNETTYLYNAFGDLLTLDSPDTGSSVFRYDEAGNRTSKTDARGVETRFEYDKMNRLTRIDYPNDIDTQFIYDTGSAWSVARRGRLARMIDESGETEYRYDGRGNPKEITTQIDDVAYRIWYDYDNVGRVRTVVYPGGRRIDYSRDRQGNVERITQTVAGATTELLNAAEYQAFGPNSALTYGTWAAQIAPESNLTQRVSQFDLAGRTTLVVGTYESVDGAGVTSKRPIGWQHQYYDSNSNIRRARRTIGGYELTYYTYDQLNRLQNSSPRSYWEQKRYEYDPNGNRIKAITKREGTIETAVEIDSNRLATVTNYDAVGNELNFGKREYGESNRLRRVFDETANEFVEYSYNGFGRRVKKTNGSTSLIFHYDNDGRLMAETNEFGEPVTEYIYLNGQPFALIEGAELASAETPSLVIDQTGWGNVWRRWNHPEASGGQVLVSPPENSADLATGSQANYQVNVSEPGSYWLYVRGRGSDLAGDNAHFTDSVSGQTSVLEFRNDEWKFEWNLRPERINVTNGDLESPITITMTRRQRDTEIDVFVLSSDPQLSPDALDSIVGLNGTSDTVSNTYVWEAEGEEPWSANGGEIYFYHNDHLGTPQFLTDGWGNAVWRATYDPFGQATITNEIVTNNLRFPGQYYDSESGLHYNLFRDYDPSTGRYVQSDPIGLLGGMNTYSYALSNPVRFIDPYGLYCLTAREISAIAGGIGGAFSGGLAGAALASPTGPGAAASAAALGTIGGIFGAAFGYFGTNSEGAAAASGAINAAVTGGNSPIASAFGGAVGGAVSSELQANGVNDSLSGIAAGTTGGFVGSAPAAFVSAGAPSSVSAAISSALRAGLNGGLAGLSGAALSAAVAEALRAGNDCCEK